MEGCCETISIRGMRLSEANSIANLQTFNKDIVNMLYSLKAIELMMGKDISLKLKEQLIYFIQNDEVPTDWSL